MVARTEARGARGALALGLGAVALLIGGVGVANVMVVSVLERGSEIGLRRALRATRRFVAGTGDHRVVAVMPTLCHVWGSNQPSHIGGLRVNPSHRARFLPMTPMIAGLAASVVTGVIAGLYPALRAARMAPTAALRSV
jgi:putative ABC transport system permease protein